MKTLAKMALRQATEPSLPGWSCPQKSHYHVRRESGSAIYRIVISSITAAMVLTPAPAKPTANPLHPPLQPTMPSRFFPTSPPKAN